METRKKIQWDSGLSEILSFALLVPYIVLMLTAIIAAIHISSVEQKLSYAAYSVCRSAVICENKEYAQDRSAALMKEMYGKKYIQSGFDTKVNTDGKYNDGDTFYTLELVGDNATWAKGNMIKCTIYQYVDSSVPFTSGFRAETIVMMIENGKNISS